MLCGLAYNNIKTTECMFFLLTTIASTELHSYKLHGEDLYELHSIFPERGLYSISKHEAIK